MRSFVPSDFLSAARRARQLLPWLALMGLSAASAQGGIEVPTVAAQVRSVSVGFELDGVVEPVKQSTVSAQAGGRIAKLLVKVGDKVRAGQLLVVIDDREASTGVERSQAQVVQAQAELRNAQAQFERTRELQGKGFVSAAALDVADSQLKGAQAGRAQAGASARQSALAQGYTRVSAPFDGWVLQAHAETGELALPGKPLLTLYAPWPLRVVVQVPVSRAGAAQSAQAVEVAVPGAGGAVQWLRPSALSSVPTADPVSQTIEWRLALSNEASARLLPGQQVRVRFAGGQAQRLLVPAASVLQRGELTAVYVASGPGFVLKAIRPGADHGPQGLEVLLGLRGGERVALDPVKAGLAGAQPAGAQ